MKYIGDEVDIIAYGEICCDNCNEVIHNHMDCPVCKRSDVGTDQYCDMHYENIISCQECGSVFEKISGEWYSGCTAKIIELKS
jgi:hypothetical protein